MKATTNSPSVVAGGAIHSRNESVLQPGSSRAATLGRLGPMNKYSEAYNHPLWQKKRLEVMERAGFKCEMCGDADSQLYVHHHYYVAKRKPWEYESDALSVLCEYCHDFEHDWNACGWSTTAAPPMSFWELRLLGSLVEQRDDWKQSQLEAKKP